MPLMTTMSAPLPARDSRAWFVDAREINPLMLLLAIYAITALYQADELIIAVNVTGSCGLILVMLYGCWRKLEQTPDAIWTPLLWFRVASAVYFGLGQLAPYVANDATLARMQETYGFTDADILKLNAISVVGVICVLAGASIIGI